MKTADCTLEHKQDSLSVRSVEINNHASIKKLLQEIDVDESYLSTLADKFVFNIFLVKQVDNRAANILKQEMLNLGAEAAVSKQVSSFIQGKSSAVIAGTDKHIHQLISKISLQPYGLKKLSVHLQQLLHNKANYIFKSGTRTFDMLHGPVIMGILNVAPDSFYDGGAYGNYENAVKQAMRLADEGAAIVDVGGESSRPGADYVDETQELNRVLPVISFCVKHDIPVSIDTRKSSVARASLDAGACIVNDISALRDSPDMARIISSYNAGLILMHMQGNPQSMQTAPAYYDVISEVKEFLEERVKIALLAGINHGNISIDPGIGFGKTREHNVAILQNLKVFNSAGCPVMIGVSRKSLIGKHIPPSSRLPGSLALAVSAYQQGVRMFRVHDVYETHQALTMMRALEN